MASDLGQTLNSCNVTKYILSGVSERNHGSHKNINNYMYISNNNNTKDINLHSHMSKIFYETLSVIKKMLPINEIFGLNNFYIIEE